MTTFRGPPPWYLLSLLALLNVVRADVPLVDFDRMGTVGLVGAFAGLDFFNSSANLTFDPSTSTLLLRSPHGALTRIASTSAGGIISAGCAIGNTYYIAGEFSSIGTVTASNVASYNPAAGTFAALGKGGPNGPVNALFCDSTHNKLWAGGHFTTPASAVAVWDTGSSSWSAPPFGGLTGVAAEVLSITTNSSQASLFFSGSFVAPFQGAALNTNNNPNVPFSSGATPFSSSLVPIPLQTAQIEGSPSSIDPNFSQIQNILCPTGNDGPGQTWFAADGSSAQITARTFQYISASGIRLGNTFLNGRGTTEFTVTTIPDNTVQQLSFVNPATGQTQTCTNCPLSVDATVPYQDFTFQNARIITGVQVTLSAFQGAGAGLHLFQILSSGAFASAVAANNDISCFAPVASGATFTGQWTDLEANTNIPATTQAVLVSTVNVGTTPANGPSFTWMPYISASGQYTINLLVPGCTDFQDCALRTSVQVEVFPGGGQDPVVTVIDQRNQNDAVQQIYNGPVVPSSPNFVLTITMTLADNPAGAGQNGQYRLVADRVQLILTKPDATANGPGIVGNGKVAFGFLEWPFSLTANANAATGLPDADETFLDTIGLSLFNDLGGEAAIAAYGAVISAVVHHPSGAVFLGGTFSLNAPATSNIVVFKNGALKALSGGGLNGPVTSLAFQGNTLYVGGSFSDTQSKSTQGRINGIASYDVAHDQWSPLLAGVDGPVQSLNVDNGQLAVAGKFTRIRSAGVGTGLESPGLALWNTSSGGWVNGGGFLLGSLTFVGNGTTPAKGQQQSQIIAGNIGDSLEYGASGFVLVQNGNGGEPELTPLGVQLGDDVASSSTTATTKRRGTNNQRATTTWVSRRMKFARLLERQSSTSLPPDPPAPAPAVLAGTFWINATNSKQVAIIGGNFSFANGNAVSAGIAVYNPSAAALTALQGPAISGIVRAVLVQDTLLFVGGTFTIPGTSIANFGIYDLVHNTWLSSAVPALQNPNGASAGSLQCHAICEWDVETNQWNALGDGIQGDIASVAYAGSNQDFTFSNASWSIMGNGANLPGPVTAVTVNNGNTSSIFAAGRSTDGSSSFLAAWNGHTWSSQGSALGGSHPRRSNVVDVRNLLDSSFGQASSILFDGHSFYPYIVTASESGSPGSMSGLFNSIANFSFAQHHFLATGVVILISIAIGAGIVFLLVLLGILWTLFARRDEAVSKFDPADMGNDDDSTEHRPSSLLEHINAATTSILESQSPFQGVEKETAAADAGASSTGHDLLSGPDASNYIRAETPSDAFGGGLGTEETGRPAHARYSFDGTGEGELSLAVGQEIEILDDNDHSWWYARDVRTGNEGVVPASYVY
ncbi:cortical protein marker for cell polarity-domain-containing protein [Lactifluus volemus]|nr:cortical protein marker for cell polarity-domain-containing protein [Lactifluus volemus]